MASVVSRRSPGAITGQGWHGGEHRGDRQASDSGRHHVTHRSSTATAWTRAAFAAIALVLSLAAPVAAGPLEDTTAASGRRDYATALRLWRPLADQGDAIAQFNLGLTYDKGWGAPQNDAEAAKWYRLAADQGDADAQINLGGMYHNGRGVPQNHAEALKWFRLAALTKATPARSSISASATTMAGAFRRTTPRR